MHRFAWVMLTVALAGCYSQGVSPGVVYTGKEAESHLLSCDRAKLPGSMADLWVYDGGTFNGSIHYVSFRCDTLDDCWKAVRAFRSPEPSKFTDGVQTRFAVTQHGPSFHDPNLRHPQWDLSAIRRGVSHEEADRDRRTEFWAIDLDRLRVYFHYESGGFPNDPPSVRHGR